MSNYDLIIKNGTLQSSQGESSFDIAISNGKIAKVGTNLTGATKEIDASGKWVLPGIIDTQVHFREPGLPNKEDLETGSKAAALGGVTTYLEMPNTHPATTTVDSIKDKVERGLDHSWANFGFFVGATGENLEELLKAVEVDGCCGIKIFLGSSTGSLLLYDVDKLTEIFQSTNAMIAVHSENEEMLNARKDIQKNATTAHAHPKWRNEETALSSTKMILDIAKKAGRKVHILHITSKQEMELLAKSKEYCTVECTPQHLTLHAPDCYDRLGTYAQMNPPIRSEDHKIGLWEGVTNGTVDVFGSDHAPHTKKEKDRGYPLSPSGMPGVQTILPLMLEHVKQGRLELKKLVKMLCETPAELYSLKSKGYLKEGLDADITIIDPDCSHTITHAEQASRCGWTPFDGTKLSAYPTHTIINGTVVVENGEILERPKVQPIHQS